MADYNNGNRGITQIMSYCFYSETSIMIAAVGTWEKKNVVGVEGNGRILT
jgi:hypothetical protein